MTMGKDEFYDSLEGDLSSASNASLKSYYPDQNYESASSICLNDFVLKLTSSSSSSTISSLSNVSVVVIKPAPKIYLKSKSTISLESFFYSKCNIENNNAVDVSSIVPLYDGDRNRSELKKTQNLVSTPAISPKVNNRKRQLKACSKNGPVLQETSKKSYLKLFYKRIGYPKGNKKVELNDTCRSVYGDSRRSSISLNSTDKEDFKDAEDNESCTTSLYFKDVEEANRDEICGGNADNKMLCNLVSSNVPLLNMKSISDIFSEDSIKEKKTTSNRRKTTPVSVPILGGLGPNITCAQDKLERRKKQLWYGQKCSNRNRMKVMEMKNLDKLKNDS